MGMAYLRQRYGQPGGCTRRCDYLHGKNTGRRRIPLCAQSPSPPGATRAAGCIPTPSSGSRRYQVLRSRHPKPNIYTLLDTPVGEAEYRQVVEHDYGEDGLFLDRVIVVKVIGEQFWRLNSLERPYRLEWFGKADRGEILVPAEQIVETLGQFR